MLSSTNTIKCVGIDAVPVKVECEISKGVGIHLVGLVDSAVKEALLRTVTALQAKGYRFPGKKIIINLAPADLTKTGCHYDLPIAVAFIAASEQKDLSDIDNWLIMGELALDGNIRQVEGCVQAALAVKDGGYKGCIIPSGNAREVACLLDEDTPVYGADTLDEAISILQSPQGFKTVAQAEPSAPGKEWRPTLEPSWNHLAGNETARRAIEIAAAGGHSILMMGVPGSGKSSLSKALSELLPPMSKEEAIEVAKIYSISGRTASQYMDSFRLRPFRAPHHSSSMAAMLGGGAGDNIHPGEVSLAHNGVLMFDEIIEAPKSILEALSVVMEDKSITISRLKSKVVYPADFILAATTNPCPCGYYGEGDRCTCTPRQRVLYLSKLNHRLYDRITMQVWTRPVVPNAGTVQPEDIETVRERVRKARQRQQERYAGREFRLNDNLPASALNEFCPLDTDCKELIEKLISRLGLSARAYSRILKIARTIADLEESDTILTRHLAEASSYRFLDRRIQENS